MEIRSATPADTDRIVEIARESLSSSYTDFLQEETIETAVEQWYGGDSFEELLENDRSTILVVEDDGPIAFSQSELVGDGQMVGQIHWLHVDPDHRGGGTGVRLLVRTREALTDAGADQIRGFVLEDNEGGNQFYAEHGFERAGTREVEVGDETYTETVFVESEADAGESWRGIEPVDADGEQLYVSYGEAARGSKAPFYSAYETEDGDERYGWFCGNCDSVDNAMDAMGRIQCNACNNRRKATRWDASYL